VPGIHVEIFGYDENVFGFTVLTAIMLGVWGVLRFGLPAEVRNAAG
jgi:hypothetical protein